MAKPNRPPLTVVDSTATGPAPPRQLGQHGLALWHSIQSEYEITDPGALELLLQACGAVDRVEALSEQIRADGPVVRSRGGARPHPLLREETALRAFICRTLARLGLDVEPIRPLGRPAYGRGRDLDAD
jgi:hypothetical protein